MKVNCLICHLVRWDCNEGLLLFIRKLSLDEHINCCEKPQEELHEDDDHVYVEYDFIEGAVVWAKVEGWPW